MSVLVVFVDALGPSQLEALAQRLPWLTARRALRGELGYSSGALATLLTGEAPQRHGRMCLFRAATGSAPLAPLAWLGLLPRVLHERGALRRAVARAFARHAGMSGYFALHRVPPEDFRWLDVAERDDLFTAASVGEGETFLARARSAGLAVYSARWQDPEAERWDASLAALTTSAPDLAFLYATELDGALHAEGAMGPRAEEALDRIAVQIGTARARLGEHGPVRTFVVGDHGMAAVRRAHDPRRLLAQRDPAVRAFVDSTMLRLWGPDAALDALRSALEGEGWPGTWLDTAALVARGAPTAEAAYGRALFLLDEGDIFAPSHVGGRVAGMHGYDLDASSCAAGLASDAPLASTVRTLRDVAPALLEELGLR